jgi:hypothetical protein
MRSNSILVRSWLVVAVLSTMCGASSAQSPAPRGIAAKFQSLSKAWQTHADKTKRSPASWEDLEEAGLAPSVRKELEGAGYRVLFGVEKSEMAGVGLKNFIVAFPKDGQEKGGQVLTALGEVQSIRPGAFQELFDRQLTRIRNWPYVLVPIAEDEKLAAGEVLWTLSGKSWTSGTLEKVLPGGQVEIHLRSAGISEIGVLDPATGEPAAEPTPLQVFVCDRWELRRHVWQLNAAERKSVPKAIKAEEEAILAMRQKAVATAVSQTTVPGHELATVGYEAELSPGDLLYAPLGTKMLEVRVRAADLDGTLLVVRSDDKSPVGHVFERFEVRRLVPKEERPAPAKNKNAAKKKGR